MLRVLPGDMAIARNNRNGSQNGPEMIYDVFPQISYQASINIGTLSLVFT